MKSRTGPQVSMILFDASRDIVAHSVWTDDNPVP